LILSCPLIVTERSVGVWKSKAYLAMDRLLYARSSAVIANSHATRYFVEHHFPASRAKVSVIYNGVEDLAGPAGLANQQDEFVFVMVAGLRPWKGHPFLIDAVERLIRRREGFRVRLVGDGPERSRIEELVVAKGLREIIGFYGWKEDPLPLLSAAHVSLNLSSHESLSNSVMEGMVLGKP